MKITQYIVACVFALSALTANAATITSSENAGTPLVTGAPYFFDEIILAGTNFAHSVHFTTDSDAGQGSASAVGLELGGVSGFVGDLTISLFQANYVTGNNTNVGALVATITGANLSDIAVAANTQYSFVIEGLTGSTPNNALSGAVAISPVPIPAAAWLFGSALIGLIGIQRRK